MLPVKFKMLRPSARLPEWKYESAAGADLYAAIDERVLILPGQTCRIPLGFATEFDSSHVALIYARSGTAVKRDMAPANKVGVVDSDFRGEWEVPLHNHGSEPQYVMPGERIAQVLFHEIEHPDFTVVGELSSTERGEGKYNSSGTN